jgi:hypothetical protein
MSTGMPRKSECEIPQNDECYSVLSNFVVFVQSKGQIIENLKISQV